MSRSQLFRQIFGYKIYIIFVLSGAAILSESLGIVLLIPLIELSVGSAPSESEVLTYISELYGMLGISLSEKVLIFTLSGFLALKSLSMFFSLSYVARLRAHYQKDIRLSIVEGLEASDYQYQKKKGYSYFSNIINDQASRALMAFYFYTQYVGSLFGVFIYLIMAVIVSWQLGIMTAIFAIPILFLYKKINDILKELSNETSNASVSLTKSVNEFVNGYQYLKTTEQTYSVIKKVSSHLDVLKKNTKKSGIFGSFTISIREPLAIFSVLIMALYANQYLDATLASIMVSLLLFFRALTSILGAQTNLQNTLEFIGGLYKVRECFDDLKKNFVELNGKLTPEDLSIVQFKNVFFKYNSSPEYILSNMSFKCHSGEITTILGASGSGKSTIIDIICGNLRPNKGEVIVGSADVRSLDKTQLGSQIGFVPQAPIIFDESLEFNISLNEKVDDKKIEEVIELLRLDEIPRGIPLGEMGSNISGGQKQRIAIGRELYRNARILIFDEITSALDHENKENVFRILEDLRLMGLLIINVTHDASMTNISDQCITILSEASSND